MPQGIYRQHDWVVVQKEDGARTALRRDEYEVVGYRPAFQELETDEDYHVHILERGGSMSSPPHRLSGLAKAE
jgi:hypothetical protein